MCFKNTFNPTQVVEDVTVLQSDTVAVPSVTLCPTPGFRFSPGAFESGVMAMYDFDNYCPGREGKEFVECINKEML